MEKELYLTETFKKWKRKLKKKNKEADAKVTSSLYKLANGIGDVKVARDKVSELRIHFGKGYRIYFTMHSDVVIVLLCGGDKRTQDVDIEKAIELISKIAQEGLS